MPLSSMSHNCHFPATKKKKEVGEEKTHLGGGKRLEHLS